MLVELIDKEGFAGESDFLYLPIDFNSQVSLGYAFVNLISVEAAGRFWAKFDGYNKWIIPSRKISGVSWSRHQGLDAQVACYRNSPLMTGSAPDEYRPILFHAGHRVPFPAATAHARQSRR